MTKIVAWVECLFLAVVLTGSRGGAEELDPAAQCEGRLKALFNAVSKYVGTKGDGRYYPDALIDLAKEKLVDARTGLCCPADPDPQETGGCLLGYLSAFDILEESLDINIPAMRPIIWDKAGTHEGLNLVLLANGEILKVRDEDEFREYVSGWETRRYLDTAKLDRMPTATLLQKLKEEAEEVNPEELIGAVAAKGPKALPEIFKEMTWSLPMHRKITIAIVREMGPAVEGGLVQDLNSRDIVTRERALELLALLGSRAADERFIKMLEAKVESAQLVAIEALTTLQTKAAVPALTRLAQSPKASAASRAAAIEALGKLGGAETKTVIQPMLLETDLAIKIRAARALARLKDPAVLPVLQKLTLEAKEEQRVEVLAAFAALGTPEALKRLQGELRIQSEPRVLAALKTVREEKVVGLIEDLLPLLESGPSVIRMAAARTLGDLGERSALSALYQALTSNAKNLDLVYTIQVAIDQVEENGLLKPEEDAGVTVGNTMIVAADNAPMFQGNQLLATLEKGQSLTIREKKGKWYGVSAVVSGQNYMGWIEETLLTRSAESISIPSLARIRNPETKIMDGQDLLAKLPAGFLVILAEERAGLYRVLTIWENRRVMGWVGGQDILPLSKDRPPLAGPSFQLKKSLGLPRYTDAGITSIAVSADSKWFAVGGGSGRVDVWEVETGRRITEQRESRPILATAFSRKDRHLFLSTDREIKEFDLGKKVTLVGTFPWKRKEMQSVWLLPDQERGVYACVDSGKGEQAWQARVERYKGMKKPSEKAQIRGQPGEVMEDFVEGEIRSPSGSKPPVKAAENPPSGTPASIPSPPGKSGKEIPPDAAARLEKESEVADMKVGMELWDGIIRLPQPQKPVYGLASTGAGFYLLAKRPTRYELIELFQFNVLGTLETGSRGVHAAAFFPSNQFVATGGSDGLVRIWETLPMKMRKVLRPEGGKILALAVASNEQLLSISMASGGLQLWDMQTEKMLQRLPHKGAATVLQFSADSRVLIAGNLDNTVAVYAP